MDPGHRLGHHEGATRFEDFGADAPQQLDRVVVVVIVDDPYERDHVRARRERVTEEIGGMDRDGVSRASESAAGVKQFPLPVWVFK